MPLDAIEVDHRSIQSYSYAVVNPLQVDEDEWSDLPMTPIVPERFKTQAHLFPLLLTLDELDFETRVGLLDRMHMWEPNSDFPFFSALIQSSAAPLRIQRHLARQLTRRRAGSVDLLRPFDPRVFRHLNWLLTTEQMDALLGPIEAWAWREPYGIWRQTYRRQVSKTLAPRLHDSQWASYARFGMLNSLIARLHDVAPHLNVDASRARELDGFLELAERVHHLGNLEDRRLFAEQAIRYHPRIHTHAALRERLQKAAARQTSYVRACADLGEMAMHQLVREIELQGTERMTP